MATLASIPNNTNSSWYKDASLRKNMLAATVCYFGSFALGYDGSYLNTCQSLPSWQAYFNNPAGTRLGLFSASAYLPALVLLPFFSYSCDAIGRRYSAGIGALLVIAGAIVGALAKNEGMLIAGRVLVGTPGSLLVLGANLLLNEILHPRLRSIGGALFLTAYYTGSTVAAWTGYAVVQRTDMGDWNWRLVTLLQCLGPIIFLAGLIILVPESPRWLIAKGRREEAHKMLASHHANGSMDDPLVLKEIEEIEEAIEREKVNKQGFSAFLSTPGNRHRLLLIATVACGSQTNGVSLFSYYLAPVLKTIGVTSAAQQTAINGGLNIYNLFLALFGALTCEKFGRRPLWIYATAMMLVSYSILIALSATYEKTASAGMGYGVIVMIFLCFGAYDVAWTPLSFSYSTEILPYSLRSSGMGLFVWLQNITQVFNQFVNPVGLEAISWKYYWVFWAILVVLLTIIVWKFPETKGRTLEEVALIFDGADALGDTVVNESQLEKGDKTQSLEHVEYKESI
ncbi:uncharacterized protein JCM15063_002393 [Sporobolomyces koalae]|uniref:uncharacterized protein n=1 Tax=Sporobolomyces koalae TaxID=500713 RepID=UPI0031723C1D